jgi:hypothetical protein
MAAKVATDNYTLGIGCSMSDEFPPVDCCQPAYCWKEKVNG